MVKKKWNAEKGKHLWGYDIRVRDPVTGKKTRRLRFYECETRDQAEAAVAAIKMSEHNAKYGLQKPSDGPLLRHLVERRPGEIVNQHERTRAKRVLETWLKLLAPPGWKPKKEGELPDGKPIRKLETPDIALYVKQRQADGQSASSIDRELNIISAALNAAKDEYYPADLRSWAPPKIPRPKVPKTRRERIITDEEYRQILDYLQRPRTIDEKQLSYQRRIRAAHLLRFALQTGMRPKEIWKLKWPDIDWDGNRIKVRGTKTENRGNSTRYIPLSPSITEIVKARQAVEESAEYVFSISGSPRDPDYDLLKEACEANGIAYGRSIENGFELYCARHTFTTRLLQAGLSLAEVGAVTGHSDRELILYYSHVTPETAARTISKMEEIELRRLAKQNQSGHSMEVDSEEFPETSPNLIN